jgi:hypothetical protein
MSSLESYYILCSTYDGNRNHHIGDLVEHTGLFFHKVANARCDVCPKKFWADTNLTISPQHSLRSWKWRHHDPLKVWYPRSTLHGVTTQKITIRTLITVKKKWKCMLFVSWCCVSDIWCSTARMRYESRASQRVSQCVQYQENQRSSPIVQTILHKHAEPQTSQHVFLQTATRGPQVSSQYLYVLISNFIFFIFPRLFSYFC